MRCSMPYNTRETRVSALGNGEPSITIITVLEISPDNVIFFSDERPRTLA